MNFEHFLLARIASMTWRRWSMRKSTWSGVYSPALICEIICGRFVDRQTLWLSEEIKAARKDHDQAHEDFKRRGDRRAAPTPLQAAKATIAALRVELAECQQTIDGYHERFATYLRNARDHDVTQEMLQKPLPSISRSALHGSRTRKR